MAVKQHLARNGRKIWRETPGLGLARDKFLEEERMRRRAARVLAGKDSGDFIAKRQNATRLQPYDGNAARKIGHQGGETAGHFAARRLDITDRKKSPPAT